MWDKVPEMCSSFQLYQALHLRVRFSKNSMLFWTLLNHSDFEWRATSLLVAEKVVRESPLSAKWIRQRSPFSLLLLHLSSWLVGCTSFSFPSHIHVTESSHKFLRPLACVALETCLGHADCLHDILQEYNSIMFNEYGQQHPAELLSSPHRHHPAESGVRNEDPNECQEDLVGEREIKIK